MISQILISDQVWSRAKKSQQITRLNKLIKDISAFYHTDERIANSNIRKLKTGLYKIRIGQNRLFFRIEKNHHHVLKLIQIGNHKEGESAHKDTTPYEIRAEKTELFTEWSSENNPPEVASDHDATLYTDSVLFRVWSLEDIARLEKPKGDLSWYLDDEQKRFCDATGPIILKGAAGSGKTTIALYRLMTWNNSSSSNHCLYITFSSYLKKHAQEQYESLHNNPIDVDFLTIEELCQAQFSDIDRQNRFNPEKHVNFDVFVDFIKTNIRIKSSIEEINKLWEEFRGVIKGSFYCAQHHLLFLTNEIYNNLEKYDDISSKDSLFSQEERKEIYAIFKKYQDWLKKSDYWDDLDLTQQSLLSLEKSGQKKIYHQIIVDELQDLTTYHIELILKLSCNMDGLFLTGDAHQSIYPSRFKWERIKNQIYRHQEKNNLVRKNKENKVQLNALHKNYRCSAPIVTFANEIANWRKSSFKDDSQALESVLATGSPICMMDTDSVLQQLSQNELAINIMIIVPDEAYKKNLITLPEQTLHTNKGNVFTIHESKGLEANTVFILNFFESFSEISQPVNQSNKHHLMYIINLLNVAATRARVNLIFLENKELPIFPPLQNTKFAEKNESYQLLNIILQEKSTHEDFLQKAMELEEKDLLEQAADFYYKAGYLIEHYKCLAVVEERKTKFKVAAEYYLKAEHYKNASKCFEKANLYTESFTALLHITEHDDEYGSIEKFLSDEKKMSKLQGDVMGSIFNAIQKPNTAISIATLFQYSRTIRRIQREEIKKQQRHISHILLTSKDAKEKIAHFNDALNILKNIEGKFVHE